MSETAPGVVTDKILGGRLTLRQPAAGHRAGTDAVLLAAAARVEPGDRLVDVGAGVGTVGLLLARRAPDLTGLLLDADPAVGALAAENCRLNGLEDRLRPVTADLFDGPGRRAAGLADGAATLVVSNPPFLLAGETRASPTPGRAQAHVLDAAHGHADWLRAALSLLAPHGRFHAIHRPDALPALLPACEGRLGAVQVLPVYGKPGLAAVRIILSGVKGSRAPLSLAPGLTLHGPDGRFTGEAEAIHGGEALLSR